MQRLVDEEDNEIEVEDGDELNYIIPLLMTWKLWISRKVTAVTVTVRESVIEAGVLDIKLQSKFQR